MDKQFGLVSRDVTVSGDEGLREGTTYESIGTSAPPSPAA